MTAYILVFRIIIHGIIDHIVFLIGIVNIDIHPLLFIDIHIRLAFIDIHNI